MARIALFIDGAYLKYVLKDEYSLVRIDYQALALAMAGDIDILRTYYYDCPPWQSPQPTPEESDRFAKAQSFFTALNRLPRYEVRLGRLARRGLDEKGRPVFEQKRVDIMLGVDMALLSGKNQITHAALLAGDSDFIPAVSAAKNEGVLVRLYHGKSYHKDLWDCVDERVPITKAFVNRITMAP
ncbi:MAG TPA: NYN domain-containing protein [Dehalococcoidia bacterium]|nr:NYN domain-containing protein [Dehalococcoidia bacterium]